MASPNRPRFAAVWVWGVLLLSLILRPGGAEPPVPPELQNVGITPTLGKTIPAHLTFIDESAQRVPLSRFFQDKPVLLVLAYYECPMLCTLVLNGVNDTMKKMDLQPGKDFTILVVSIDPAETAALAAAKKQAYLADYGHPEAAAGWHWMVGEEANIKALADAVGFKYHYDPAQKLFAHAAGIFVLTPTGKLSQVLYGIEYSPRDLRWALIEASEGKIGSALDRIVLFCYHYDPSARRYTLFASRVMMAGGVLTMIVLGGLLGGLWLWERRRSGNPPALQVAEPESPPKVTSTHSD